MSNPVFLDDRDYWLGAFADACRSVDPADLSVDDLAAATLFLRRLVSPIGQVRKVEPSLRLVH